MTILDESYPSNPAWTEMQTRAIQDAIAVMDSIVSFASGELFQFGQHYYTSADDYQMAVSSALTDMLEVQADQIHDTDGVIKGSAEDEAATVYQIGDILICKEKLYFRDSDIFGGILFTGHRIG